jgi:hypothetical protein
LAAPTAFDGAGSIFRVTPDGTKFTVGDYANRADIRREPFVAPTATQARDIEAGVLAQLIGVPVSANAAVASKYRVRQVFGSVQEINTTDDGVRSIVDDFYRRDDLNRNDRYFLVRRAVQARSVTYEFDRDLSASFGGEVAANILRVSPTARYTRADGARYENTFADSQNVCILVQPLPVPRPPAVAPAAPPIPPPDDVPLFRRVGQTLGAGHV